MNSLNLLEHLDAFSYAGLILDEDGLVVQTNEHGREYLGSKLNVGRRGPPLKRGTTDRAIEFALTKANQVSIRGSQQLLDKLGYYIVVPRADARPLILCTLEPSEATEPLRTTAMVVFDSVELPEVDPGLLRAIFRLTPAEVRLARLLLQGMSLAEISAELGVRLETIRVQSKALFTKTGTRRQGELVALLAQLRIKSGS